MEHSLSWTRFDNNYGADSYRVITNDPLITVSLKMLS